MQSLEKKTNLKNALKFIESENIDSDDYEIVSSFDESKKNDDTEYSRNHLI